MASPAALEPEAIPRQVERILSSLGFAEAERLRDLLTFLAARAHGQPGLPAKEYEIATSVFGRSPDFDPKLDPVVRVQVGRLRAKLAEYYMNEGKADPLILEIPRGRYHLTWHAATPGTSSPGRGPGDRAAGGWRMWSGWIAAAVLSVVSGTLWVGSRPQAPPPALARFWKPFLAGPGDAIAVFANPRFAGTAVTGLRYFRDSADPAEAMNLSYTGVGDVLAVHELTKLFGLLGGPLAVKRAHLLTWDEARNRNLILIGSVEQNAPVRELRNLSHFRFKPGTSEPHLGTGGILNVHPQAGESPIYLNSGPPSYDSDYAIIALLPGLRPDRRCLIVAGTTTFGTLGVAEFVTREDSLRPLLDRLGAGARGAVLPFEALFHVRSSNGVPMEVTMKALRASSSRR